MTSDPAQEFDDMGERVEAFGEDIGRALPGWVMDGLDLIGLRTQRDHFLKSSRDAMYTQHPDPNKLTSRTGRLMRSYGPLGGTFSAVGAREGFQTVEVQGDTVVGTKGSNVPYARIHEKGGTINHPGGTPYIVTDQGAIFMRKDGQYPKNVKFTQPHSITIPARPSLGPAMQETVAEIQQRIMGHIQEMVSGRF
jgi:phage gpG-like protein